MRWPLARPLVSTHCRRNRKWVISGATGVATNDLPLVVAVGGGS